MTAGSASERVDVSILTSGHDVADARLHREVLGLIRQGLSVEVRGLGEARDAPPGCRVSVRDRGGLARRVVVAWQHARRGRGRVVMTLDPDMAVVAWPFARLRRQALVVDVHEDYAALLADREWARGLRQVTARQGVRLAEVLAGRADLTVVADDQLPPRAARDRLVVRNLPAMEHLPAPSPPDPAPRALYIGDLRASRGLITMLRAVALAPQWSLDLVGPVARQDQAEVEQMLGRDGLAGRVRLHGRMPPAAAWQPATGAWVGLCLLADTPAYRRATPSKLYEYLAAGLPVLASDLPASAALVRQFDAGVTVPPADAETVAKILNSWAADPQALSALRAAASAARDALLAEAAYDELGERVRLLVNRVSTRSPASTP